MPAAHHAIRLRHLACHCQQQAKHVIGDAVGEPRRHRHRNAARRGCGHVNRVVAHAAQGDDFEPRHLVKHRRGNRHGRNNRPIGVVQKLNGAGLRHVAVAQSPINVRVGDDAAVTAQQIEGFGIDGKIPRGEQDVRHQASPRKATTRSTKASACSISG